MDAVECDASACYRLYRNVARHVGSSVAQLSDHDTAIVGTIGTENRMQTTHSSTRCPRDCETLQTPLNAMQVRTTDCIGMLLDTWAAV